MGNSCLKSRCWLTHSDIFSKQYLRCAERHVHGQQFPILVHQHLHVGCLEEESVSNKTILLWTEAKLDLLWLPLDTSSWLAMRFITGDISRIRVGTLLDRYGSLTNGVLLPLPLLYFNTTFHVPYLNYGFTIWVPLLQCKIQIYVAQCNIFWDIYITRYLMINRI